MVLHRPVEPAGLHGTWGNCPKRVGSTGPSRMSDLLPLLRTAPVLLAFLGAVGVQTDARSQAAPEILAACAAFAPDGTSGTVTVNAAGLLLEVTDPLGKVTRLTEPLRYPMPNLFVGKRR